MISTPKCVTAAVVFAALLIPATASAGIQVHKLTGTFQSETVPGTGKVSIKVVVKNGKPVRVKELKFQNLPAECNGSPVGTMSGSAGKNENGDGIEVGRLLQWFSYPGNGARTVSMTGRLSKSGKRITKGRLQVGNNTACQNAEGTFTAKK